MANQNLDRTVTMANQIVTQKSEQFFKLTLQEAIARYQRGAYSTCALVQSYIDIKFKPGWKISIDPQEAIEELGITISQFRRAIKKLSLHIHLYTKRYSRIQGANNPIEAVSNTVESCDENRDVVTKSVTLDDEKRDLVTKSGNSDCQTPSKINTCGDLPDLSSDLPLDPFSDLSLEETKVEQRSPIEPKIEQRSPEEKKEREKPKKASKKKKEASEERSPLSDLPGEKREEFLKFAFGKVDELPTRPTLPMKWIAANYDDLYSEFKFKDSPQALVNKDKEFSKWYSLMAELGNVRGRRVEDGKYLVQKLTGEWAAVEELLNSGWTLEYLKKRVSGSKHNRFYEDY